MLTLAEAEAFLYRECRLLDERRLEEWLELFTEDGVYWLPIVGNSDPEHHPSLVYEHAAERAQRVYAILNTPHHSQIPPSRTHHHLSNIELVESGTDSATVLCNLLLIELRPGHPQQAGLGVQRFLSGRAEYRLRKVNDQVRIALKKVMLIDADMPVFNLTFTV